MCKTLMTVAGQPVLWDGEKITFRAGMTIDADGSPWAYHPDPKRGLDDLANAGRPGNWWALVTDSRGRPLIQGPRDPAPGFYISTTAYTRYPKFRYNDPRCYLESKEIPFIVVPGPLRSKVRPVVLGCRAVVRHRETGREIEAVVGDIGPATHLGEGSIALAKALGIPADARKGGTSSRILEYTIFPGVPAPGFELKPA